MAGWRFWDRKIGDEEARPLPDEEIGEDGELLRVARERYQKGVDADRDNRDEGGDDLRNLAGDQWPDEIRQERLEDNRPVLTINRLPQFVRQVTGEIRQNRPSIAVRPADDVSDDKIADVYTGLIRHIQYASDAAAAYVTAAESAASCGIGHFRVVTDYSGEDTFEQDILVKRMTNPYGVTWDPHAVEPTRKDARYCFVEEVLDIATFRVRYPNASMSGWDFQRQNTSWLGDWVTHQTVRVAEYWTVEPEPRTLAMLIDGKVIDVTDLDDEDGVYLDTGTGEPLVTMMEDGKPRTRKVWRNKVQMRIVNGAEVLEGPFTWPGRYIPIIPVIGDEIHIENQTVRFGIIRFAKDAQRMYNYMRSMQTERLALEPKAPWLVTVKNIIGLESIWKQANTRNLAYLPYQPDKDNPGHIPTRNVPQMGSSAVAQEVQTAAEELHATTGIYPASIGAKSNETSGRAIIARESQSNTSTYVYTDNLNRALRHCGAILIDLIPKIYDTERVVRILNEDGTSETVKINTTVEAEAGGMKSEKRVNDLSAGKYDVVVTTGPSYATKRQEAAEGILALVQAAPETGRLILDLLVKNLDWPGAEEIAERLRKTLPPGLVEPEEGEEEIPPEPTPEALAAQAEAEGRQREQAREDALAQAEIAKTEAETEGKQLENATAALALAMQNGTMEAMIRAQVEQIVAGGLNAQPPDGMPMQ